VSKILIVEDELAIIELLSHVVASSVDEVITARDGGSAWESYQEHKPDIVTTDLGMRPYDGYWFLDKLVENDPNAKVIIVSGLPYDDRLEKYVAATNIIQGVIKKPLEMLELVDIVKKVLI